MAGLTHFDGKGDAHMVDVSDKDVTARVAVAECHVKMAPETYDIITEGRAKRATSCPSPASPASWAPSAHPS